MDSADIDFALSLQSLGYRSTLEPDSVVRATAAVVDQAASFGSGCSAERVFWRHAATRGWLGSLMLHPWAVLGSVLRDWQRPGGYLQLLGRLTSLFGLPAHLTHAAKVRQAVERFLLESPPATTTPEACRRNERPLRISCSRGSGTRRNRPLLLRRVHQLRVPPTCLANAMAVATASERMAAHLRSSQCRST